MQSMSSALQMMHAMRTWLLPALMARTAHVGEYKFTVVQADFDGWMLCDGREVARADYPALYALLGDAFGTPADAANFKLPDARGRAVAAASQARGVGAAVGAETHTLTQAQMPLHTHTATTDSAGAHSHAITDPGHTHTQTTNNDDENNSGGNPPGFSADSAGQKTWNNINASTTGVSINSGGAHVHTLTTAGAGGSDPVPLMQPTLFAGNLFIFAGRA